MSESWTLPRGDVIVRDWRSGDLALVIMSRGVLLMQKWISNKCSIESKSNNMHVFVRGNRMRCVYFISLLIDYMDMLCARTDICIDEKQSDPFA